MFAKFSTTLESMSSNLDLLEFSIKQLPLQVCTHVLETLNAVGKNSFAVKFIVCFSFLF